MDFLFILSYKCMLLLLEPPNRGSSNTYTQHTIISEKNEETCLYYPVCLLTLRYD